MNKRRESINDFSEKILRSLKFQNAPYDPYLAIEKIGGKVEWLNSVYMEDSIKRTGDESFIVRIYNDSCEERKRFILSRTLGYLFLTMGYLTDPKKWDLFSDESYKVNDNYLLQDCMDFALSFLMPKNEFTIIANQHLNNGLYSTKPIANYFNVSIRNVQDRGNKLGIFQTR